MGGAAPPRVRTRRAAARSSSPRAMVLSARRVAASSVLRRSRRFAVLHAVSMEQDPGRVRVLRFQRGDLPGGEGNRERAAVLDPRPTPPRRGPRSQPLDPQLLGRIVTGADLGGARVAALLAALEGRDQTRVRARHGWQVLLCAPLCSFARGPPSTAGAEAGDDRPNTLAADLQEALRTREPDPSVAVASSAAY